MTTIRVALNLATQYLTQARQAQDLPVENPQLDAQVLLSHVLNQERSYLYTYPEQELDSVQEACWQELLVRRAQGEPVAYLVGQKAFFGLDFNVDRRALIPRPETELLVETALVLCRQRLGRGETPVVADIGTGSGAIPISLAVNEPRLPYLYAIDISADALELAHANCQRHGVENRVRLLQGNLLAPLPEKVDLLLANLPYIGTNEQAMLLPDVLHYEPHLALFSGREGLDLLRSLLVEAHQSENVHAGTTLLLEIGYQQRELLTMLASQLWPHSSITCLRDYAGWDRVLQIEVDGSQGRALPSA
jgi:release factor glutamine methyltransferase